MNVQYISNFTLQQVFQAHEQSHELWGGNQNLDDRYTRFLRLSRIVGPSVLQACGLINEKNQVVASAKKYFIELMNGEMAVGLGAIFTDPLFRKNGFAERLITEILNEARAKKFGAAFLFSDIDPGYYKKQGFVELPAVNWELPVSTHVETRIQSRRATDSDAAKLLDWYSSSQRNKGVNRKLQTWSFFREINHVQEDWIVHYDGVDIGYISLSGGANQSLFVNEWFAPEEFAVEIWNWIFSTARTRNLTHVRGWKDLNTPLLPNAVETRRSKAIPMIVALESSVPHFTNGEFGAVDHF